MCGRRLECAGEVNTNKFMTKPFLLRLQRHFPNGHLSLDVQPRPDLHLSRRWLCCEINKRNFSILCRIYT